MVSFIRRLLNGLLAVYYLISSRKLFKPHIDKNPNNAAFIVKVCGDSFFKLAWNLFLGGFHSDDDRGLLAQHVQPSLGDLKEGDPLPRDSRLIPVTFPDKTTPSPKNSMKPLRRVRR